MYSRCPRYPNLQPNCRLVYDPLNPCCQKPVCGAVVAPTPPVGATPVPTVGQAGHTPVTSSTPGGPPTPRKFKVQSLKCLSSLSIFFFCFCLKCRCQFSFPAPDVGVFSLSHYLSGKICFSPSRHLSPHLSISHCI